MSLYFWGAKIILRHWRRPSMWTLCWYHWMILFHMYLKTSGTCCNCYHYTIIHFRNNKKDNKYINICTEIIVENQTLWFLDQQLVSDKLWWSCVAWCWTFLSNWITCACIWGIEVQPHNVHEYGRDIYTEALRIWVDVPWNIELLWFWIEYNLYHRKI